MSTTLKTSSLAAAIFIGLVAGTSNAQEVIEAKIPFSFVVGRVELPAGRYRFTNDQSVLMISGKDNHAGMFVLTYRAAGRDPNGEDPVVVFDRHEKTYRLREIWDSETEGLSLVTRRHRDRAQPIASITSRVLISPNANEAR